MATPKPIRTPSGFWATPVQDTPVDASERTDNTKESDDRLTCAGSTLGPSQSSDQESECGDCSTVGHVSDEDGFASHGRISLRVRNISGVIVGYAEVDEDATVGQLRARLGMPPEWYALYKHFVVADTSFEFEHAYTRFMKTKAARKSIQRIGLGRRVLDVTVVASSS